MFPAFLKMLPILSAFPVGSSFDKSSPTVKKDLSPKRCAGYLL
jgi:hypothetical protein